MKRLLLTALIAFSSPALGQVFDVPEDIIRSYIEIDYNYDADFPIITVTNKSNWNISSGNLPLGGYVDGRLVSICRFDTLLLGPGEAKIVNIGSCMVPTLSMENKIQLKKEGKKVCILKEKLGLKSYDDYAFYLCLDDFAPTQSMYSDTKGEWKSDAKFVKYSDDRKYVGEYKDDNRHGKGTMTFPDGTKFVGEWKDDKLNGKGTTTFANGAKYIGEWKDGKYNGQGTFTFADGTKYVGEWKDAYRHGQGTYTFLDGTKHIGEWKDDKLNGKGTMTFANGDKYVGEHKEGFFNGQGTFTFADGTKYVGEWKDGNRHGQGTFTFADGTKYVGEWKDDNRHGLGTLINSLGEEIDTSLYYKGKIVSDICEKLSLPIGTAEHRQCILRYMNKIDNED